MSAVARNVAAAARRKMSTAAASSSELTLEETRKAIARLTNRVLEAAGHPAPRRTAYRRGSPPHDLANQQPALLEAISIFEDGARRGAAVYDRATTSLLARACVVPHAAWEDRERQRALELFERTLVLQSDVDDTALPAAPVQWQCEADGCDFVATFGDAAEGCARTCHRHRRPGDVRVDLSVQTVHAIADSLICTGNAEALERGAALYAYLMHTVTDRRPGKTGPLDSAIVRLLGACASVRMLPTSAPSLLEHVVGRRDRAAINAYIRACAAVGDVDAAFSAHEAGEAAGVRADLVTVTALVTAASSARQLVRAIAVVDDARDAGLDVDTDSYLVAVLLRACAVARSPGRATEVYERAMQAGLTPTSSVYNALALSYAADGQVDATERTLNLGRDAARDSTGPPASEAKEARDADTSVATLLRACIEAGDARRAVEAFYALTERGYRPRTSGPHAVLLDASARAGGGFAPRQEAAECARIYAEALDEGVPLDSRLLSALMNACVYVGDARAAHAAFTRGVGELCGTPDVYVLRALLRACVLLRQPDALRSATNLAERHRLPLRGAGDLLLRAHAAAVDGADDTAPGIPNGAAEGGGVGAAEAPSERDVLCDAALDLYASGREQQWEISTEARRALLGMLARSDRVLDALEVLQHLQQDAIEPGVGALDELFRACRRGGVVDEATLQLWLGAEPATERP